MELKEQLSTAEELLVYLQTYNAGGRVRMTGDITAKLDKLYRSIFEVGGTLSLSCSSCLVHYLNQIASWHETAYARWSAENAIHLAEGQKKKRKKN